MKQQRAPVQQDRPLDLATLVENGLTVRALIDECGVEISSLYSAGIVRTLDDLRRLQFDPRDLIRNRRLFRCDTLVQLFKSSIPHMRQNGLAFELVHLLPERDDSPQFFVAELQALQFSLEPLIDAGLTAYQLRLLSETYPLSVLRGFGLTRAHCKKMGISPHEALAPRHLNGFGWDREEFDRMQ